LLASLLPGGGRPARLLWLRRHLPIAFVDPFLECIERQLSVVAEGHFDPAVRADLVALRRLGGEPGGLGQGFLELDADVRGGEEAKGRAAYLEGAALDGGSLAGDAFLDVREFQRGGPQRLQGWFHGILVEPTIRASCATLPPWALRRRGRSRRGGRRERP